MLVDWTEIAAFPDWRIDTWRALWIGSFLPAVALAGAAAIGLPHARRTPPTCHHDDVDLDPSGVQRIEAIALRPDGLAFASVCATSRWRPARRASFIAPPSSSAVTASGSHPHRWRRS